MHGWTFSWTFSPWRGYAPRDIRERSARLLDCVLPERGVLGHALIGWIGVAPNTNQAARGVDSDVGIEARELVDTINRLPDARVHEQQDPLQHIGWQLHCLGGGHDRLATVIFDNAQRRSARNVERALELAQHSLGLVLQGGRFKPPDIGLLHHRWKARRRRRQVFEADQDQAALERVGGEENPAELL